MSFLEKLNSPAVAAVVIVVFVILDGFLFYRYQQSLQSPGNGAINAQTEERATRAEGMVETTTLSEEQNGVQVAVGVVSVPVGLSVYEDETLVHDQVTDPGYYEEYEAEQSITIAAADGGAVQVGVDGEDLEPLGESGEGVTRTFTNESESE